ncbi:MAG: electron transport complex subunit RsxC, partial [Methylophaga nitratireducenticrescens]
MSAPLGDFPGGLKLPGHKKRSTQGPIRKTPISKQLVLPLQQHIGAAAVPIV